MQYLNTNLGALHSWLVWQTQLRRHKGSRDILQTLGLDIILVPINPQPQLPTLSIYHPPHPIGTSQGLMHLQPMPRVNRNPIIPPDPELRQPTILRLKLQRRDLLKGIFFLVPGYADIVYGLLGEVLQELRAEGVRYFVLHVEFAGVLGEDVDWRVIGDGVFFDLLLFFAEGEDAEFGHVGSEAVGGLGILWHRNH